MTNTTAYKLRITYLSRPRYSALVGEVVDISAGYRSVEHLQEEYARRKREGASIRVENIVDGVIVTQLGGEDRGESKALRLIPIDEPPIGELRPETETEQRFIRVPERVICGYCRGDGVDPKRPGLKHCPRCKGIGHKEAR